MQGFVTVGKEKHEECFPRLISVLSTPILLLLHFKLSTERAPYTRRRHYAYKSVPVTNICPYFALRYTKFLIIEVTEERL